MIQAKKIQPVVERVLARCPEARDDYKVLLKEVWSEYGLQLNDNQINLLLGTCPNNESVSRAARKIWESGRYLPSPKVRAERGIKAQEYRVEMKPKGYWAMKDNTTMIWIDA